MKWQNPVGDLFAHRELFDSIDADGSGIIHKSVTLAEVGRNQWWCLGLLLHIYESWAKGPWKGFPLRKPLGMQLTVSAKVFFWNGEIFFFSG